MKYIRFGQGMVLAACLGFLGGSAFAKPWWSSPALKYDEHLLGIYGAVDPHYMNKDASDQYLAFATGSGGGTVYLYSIPSLIAGTSSNDVAPIAQGDMTNFWSTAWKGIALSDDLKRVFTGQTGTKPDHTSFPVTGPWVKNVNTFNVTNDPTNVYFDGCDFGHSSQFLYSDVYASGNAAVPAKTSIVKWSVTNLLSNGIGLVSNTVVTTSLHRIRNVSSYYIGGKDLVYYGEGDDTLGVTTRKVCVYDFDLGTETELVTLDRTAETGVVAADLDVMNVKIGGIGLGQMHLYVECNDGAVFIYDLNTDGKMVGALVKNITSAQMKALVGDPALPRIRNFEITDDEQYAFVLNKPSTSDAQTKLHVLWTPPEEVAWWVNPSIKFDKDTGVSSGVDPHYMNKDESDHYLFVPLASANVNTPGQLYSIPALIAASAANDAAPIASGTPGGLYGNWKGGAISDELLRVVTGNGVPLAVTINASLPLTAPWTKDTTVFAITNVPSAWGMDGIDFSHTSQYLFSNVYNSGYRNLIAKWSVVNLNAAGLAFVTNTIFTTSLSRIRNVSDAYIGGKDLVYYGEGDDGLGLSARKVCVYDPALATETVLTTLLDRTNETGVVAADLDVMNVKVGGVGLGQMHLYIQCNDGALYIYKLNTDGKSVGALVRQFTVAEMKTLLVGSPTGTLGSSDRIRCLEFTNDEKYAFLIHTPNSGDAILHVLWTKPSKGTVMLVGGNQTTRE